MIPQNLVLLHPNKKAKIKLRLLAFDFRSLQSIKAKRVACKVSIVSVAVQLHEILTWLEGSIPENTCSRNNVISTSFSNLRRCVIDVDTTLFLRYVDATSTTIRRCDIDVGTPLFLRLRICVIDVDWCCFHVYVDATSTLVSCCFHVNVDATSTLVLRCFYVFSDITGFPATRPIHTCLSYDVASGSEITPCNKIDKPQVVYRFSGNVWRFTDFLETFWRP